MPGSSSAKQKTASSNSSGTPSAKQPNPLSSMNSLPLDLTSVERRGQPTACPEPVKKKTRPHGLQEAPTYCPTEEEWKEPFEFIKKISPEARHYGLCKIIPPDSWNPDFAIDTEVSRDSRNMGNSAPRLPSSLCASTHLASAVLTIAFAEVSFSHAQTGAQLRRGQ